MKRIWEDVIDAVSLMIGLGIGIIMSKYSLWWLLLVLPASFLAGMIRGFLEQMDSKSGAN